MADAGLETATDDNRETAGVSIRVMPLAIVAICGAAIGVAAWSWMAFGEAIYLNRLAAVVAGCF